MKAVQYFDEEYLEQCKSMSNEDILQFLEDFRLVHGSRFDKGKSRLISIKVPESLLSTFKLACERKGIKYQSRIKYLMRKDLGL